MSRVSRPQPGTLRTRAFEFAEQAGWSDADLAWQTGLTSSHINLLRRGQRQLGAKAIAALKHAFPDKSWDDLFYLEDPDQQTDGEGPKVEGAA